MRDPEGERSVEGDRISRTLAATPAPGHFLRSELAARLARERMLIDFSWESDRRLTSPRLPFVTFPYEWCDRQLHDAAGLTLRLQREAVSAGFDLKDASAWNVIFDGCRPVFCDLLSFAPLAQRKWWAMGQYVRHFLFPLLASQRRGLSAGSTFLMSRDGMNAASARRLFGPSIYLTRYGSLLLGTESAGRPPADAKNDERLQGTDAVGAFRARLHAALEWMLAGTAPRAADPARAVWANYEHDRAHYTADSLALKRRTISEWLSRIEPGWVVDLGCNTGEFSLMAAEQGAQVVALDSDHDSIQRLYSTSRDKARVHPLVAQLDDIGGGRGWAGSEHAGLAQRLAGSCDVVMMLALIHHLAVGASIPLSAVAAFAHACTRDHLIVELLDETDPQLQSLCVQRQRLASEFTMDRQREAFLAAGFSLEASVDLQPARRSLALFRKLT